MRKINYLVLHCSATPQTTTIESIVNFWKNVNHWMKPGYHFIIKADGEIVRLLPIEEPSNGVKGHNFDSINIAYIGGIDENEKAIDNRTDAQKISQLKLLLWLRTIFPEAVILGHTDFPNVAKSCPSFDVSEWLKIKSSDFVHS